MSSTGEGSDPPGDPAAPIAEPLVDECLATAFAWYDEAAATEPAPGRIRLFANYPLFSPHYQLELYGADVLVATDAELDARLGITDWGGRGIEDVVFGRAAGDDAWRVLTDPDAVCPPLPEGTEWPTSR